MVAGTISTPVATRVILTGPLTVAPFGGAVIFTFAPLVACVRATPGSIAAAPSASASLGIQILMLVSLPSEPDRCQLKGDPRRVFWLRAVACQPLRPALRLAPHVRDDVDRQPDQSTHERPVDAHELEVSADGQLEPPRRGRRIPAGHGLRDEAPDLLPVAFHDRGREVDGQVVDLSEQAPVCQQRGPELAEAALQWPGRSAVRPGRVGDDGVAGRLPEARRQVRHPRGSEPPVFHFLPPPYYVPRVLQTGDQNPHPPLQP